MTRIDIVGGGFAGFHAARRLRRDLRDSRDLRHVDGPVEVVLLNPSDTSAAGRPRQRRCRSRCPGCP